MSELYSKNKYGPCCSVPGCSLRAGTNALSQIKTFKFPKDLSLRAAWVQAIRRSNWQPTSSSVICSKHFLEGKPSGDCTHPDWIPTIFRFKPHCDKGSRQKVERYNRLKERRKGLSEIEEEVPDPKDCISTQVCEGSKRTISIDAMTDCKISDIEKLEKEVVQLKEENSLLSKQVADLKASQEVMYAINSNLKKAINNQRVADRILISDKTVTFFAGLQNAAVFWSILNFLLSFWNPKVCVHLEPHEQLMMVLMRLRLGLLVRDLAFRFEISASLVCAVFHEWIDVMAANLQSLIKWPSKHFIKKTLPDVFKDEMFENVRGIIDCSEVFIEKPSSLLARAQTYSRYKNHNTFKFLTVITPSGGISFVSHAWGGRASDQVITKESGLLDLVEDGDAYIVDRGFTCSELFALKNATLINPSFTKGKLQLPGAEVTVSRKISRVRVHVERMIQRVKIYKIFSRVIPISMLKRDGDIDLASIDKILIVCSALANCQTPIIVNK